MPQFKRRYLAWFGPLFLLFPLQTSAVPPHVFSTGDPILASEMNENFNDLDQRLAAIESGQNQTVNVDCTADANALLNTTLANKTTYVLTGMCNGPIEVFRLRNVIFEGDPAGVPKDDGIILPGGLTVNPFAAIGIYEASAELRDLTIDATGYVSNSYPWDPGGTVSAINVGQLSITRIYDVDVEGGDIGIDVFRQSYVKTYENVRVQNFNLYGVEAWGNSHVEFNKEIQIIGAPTTTAAYPAAVNTGSGGFVQVRDGGTFTPAGSGSGTENYSLSAYDNGVVRVMDSGTANLNGDVIAMRGSSIRISGSGTTVTGYIGAYDAGIIRLDAGVTQSGGTIESYRNSTIRIRGGSSVSGTLFVGNASSLRIQESSTLTGSINVQDTSTLLFNDSTHVSGTIQAEGNASIGFTNSTLANGDINATDNSIVSLFQSTTGGAIDFLSTTNSRIHLYGDGPFSGTINALDASIVDISNTTFTGSMNANTNSVITLENATISGSISANGSSSLRMLGVNHSGGGIDVNSASSLSVIASNIDVDGFSLSATRGSHIAMGGNSSLQTGSPPDSVSLSNYSTLQLEDTNLNNTGIICQDQANQLIQISGVTNLGSLAACPL